MKMTTQKKTMASGRKRLFRIVSAGQNTTDQHQHFLSLNQAPIQEFLGDYIVTSTNRRLEGIHRKNWWGFAGKKSCDQALHQVYQTNSKSYPNYLVKESKNEWNRQRLVLREDDDIDKPDPLPFAFSLVTNSGPFLPNVRKILHTCVPRFPHTGKDAEPYLHTTLPHAWVASEAEAFGILKACYDNIFETILKEESTIEDSNSLTRLMDSFASWDSDSSTQKEVAVCLPAIGCGYNGYPISEAANIALDCIHENLEDSRLTSSNTATNKQFNFNVEIRFRETRTFEIWQEQVLRRLPAQFQ